MRFENCTTARWATTDTDIKEILIKKVNLFAYCGAGLRANNVELVCRELISIHLETISINILYLKVFRQQQVYEVLVA